MGSTANRKKFDYEVNTFITDANAKEQFHQALNDFHSKKNIVKFTDELKAILDRPERLRLYDVLRPLIPLQQQMEYNMLVPYINNKQRTIQLRRPKGVTSFGFAIRGGREHGIGVFVSEVNEGAEASRQGLKVGDEIIAVNGLIIDQAIHEEVLNLMNKRPILELVVRSVGMIPVKTWEDASPEKIPPAQRPSYFLQQLPSPSSESPKPTLQSPIPETPTSAFSDSSYPPVFASPLTSPTQVNQPTQLTSPTLLNPPIRSATSSTSSQRSQLTPTSPISISLSYDQKLMSEKHPSKGPLSWRLVTPREWPRIIPSDSSISSESFPDVKVYLTFQPNQRFGCNICKGPSARPGIYIQSTTEGGLAHQVGLRTGDKLLQANSKDLQNMEFREAVDYLKSCKYVELVIRRGVGVDLFPGESSGYNSSNSSTVGDYSPKLTTATETREPDERTTMTDAVNSGGTPYSDTEDANENLGATEASIQNKAAVTEVVAEVIVHKAESHFAEEVVSGPENGFDVREEERRTAAMLKHRQQLEEQEKRKREAEEEERRNLEYVSRMEVREIDEEIINKGQFSKDSLLLKHRRASMDLIQDDVLNEIQEEDEEETGSGAQDQEVIQRMENMEKMVRTAEVLMDRALSRTSSNSSGGDSGLHMKEDEAKENDINESDKWKKTFLAEIHKTPRPSIVNSEEDSQEPMRKISQFSQSSQSQFSQSSQSQFSTRESSKSQDISNERRNEMQKRSQHDQRERSGFEGVEIQLRSSSSHPNLIESRERKPSVYAQPSTPRRSSTLQPPIGNPAAHKFVETPQVGKVTRDPMKNMPIGTPMFPPPKTPIFGTSITDSTPIEPRPPAFYYPEAKPKIVINPYVSSNARPAPKRLEYLEHHPSVATVEFALKDPPKKKWVKSSEPPKTNDAAASYVTKVLVNKPEPKPTQALIIKKPASPMATINTAKNASNSSEGSKNNLKNGTESKHLTNGKSELSDRIGFSTARSKFIQDFNATAPEKPIKPGSNSRAMSPAIQNSLLVFQKSQNSLMNGTKPAAVEVNGMNRGTK